MATTVSPALKLPRSIIRLPPLLVISSTVIVICWLCRAGYHPLFTCIHRRAVNYNGMIKSSVSSHQPRMRQVLTPGRATALLIWPAPSKKASVAARVRQVRLALRTPWQTAPASPCRNKAGHHLRHGKSRMVMPKGLVQKPLSISRMMSPQMMSG